MEETIYYKLILIKDLTYLLSFLFSLGLIGNKNIPNYMKGFYWYTSVGLFIITLQFFSHYLHIIPKEIYRVINLLSLLFHYTFLGFFILRSLSDSKDIKQLKIIFWLFIPLIIYFIIIDINNYVVFAFAITNFGLLIFCIIYYYQLFKNTPTLNLLTEPSFWIITGIFFGMSTTIPISIIGGHLLHNIPRNIFLSISLLVPFGYSVMHLFFIKAILCSVRQPRVL